MDFIDETQRIACCHLGELTGAQAEIFSRQFSDSPLSSFTLIYDSERDLLIMNRDHADYELIREFVVGYMSLSEIERKELCSQKMPGSISELIAVMDGVIIRRSVNREIFILSQQTIPVDFDLSLNMEKAILKKFGDDGIYWVLRIAYLYGVMQGKRMDRARRQRSTL